MLPPFLKSTRQSSSCVTAPFVAAYTHSQRLGGSEAHCLWWPCKSSNVHPSTVLLFVPAANINATGNPGLADFYNSYLSYIFEWTPDSFAILAHSLIGHSPRVATVPLAFSRLNAQVEGIIEVIDGIRSSFGSATRIILVGHSVGSWIVFQTLKERSDQITAAFLLFPTIMHIARTPNGNRLSWLFNGPVTRILASAARILRFVPKRALSLLFRDWPADQIEVLWSFLNCPPVILASLTMAREEMAAIKDLDTELLGEVKHKLYFFLAEDDDWVGSNKEAILREMGDEPHAVRVIHGRHGIPHAYCINHGKEIGEQSLKWLQDDVFTPTRELKHK